VVAMRAGARSERAAAVVPSFAMAPCATCSVNSATRWMRTGVSYARAIRQPFVLRLPAYLIADTASSKTAMVATVAPAIHPPSVVRMRADPRRPARCCFVPTVQYSARSVRLRARPNNAAGTGKPAHPLATTISTSPPARRKRVASGLPLGAAAPRSPRRNVSNASTSTAPSEHRRLDARTGASVPTSPLTPARVVRT